MDAALSGFVLDPSKCRMLSIDEKREIVRELSKWPDSAPEKLKAWSRRDLLEVLCAEIGKERKYTGTSKQKMIDYLLKVVSQKKSGGKVQDTEQTPDRPTSNPQPPPKRQRKNDQPSRLPIPANDLLTTSDSEAVNSTRYCRNLACGATLNLTDAFCKRCSCCICYNYDKIKDPSLWLFCSSDSCQGDACGMSCHLECVLKDERAGVVNNGQGKRLDGRYYCVQCGKENNLLGCWKKQLMVAEDARLVDVLCHRISLSHRLLSSTKKFRSLHELVDTAMKKLMAEVGPINGLPIMVRGIVHKLSVGVEVQRLCALAVESLESMVSGTSVDLQTQKPSLVPRRTSIREGVSSTSLCMVFSLEDLPTCSEELACFKLWHRKAETPSYPPEPTCTLHKLQRRFAVTDLAPSTEYVFKIVAFGESEELDTWEIAVSTKNILKNDSGRLAQGESRCEPQYRSANTDSSCPSDHSCDGDELNNNISTSINLNKAPKDSNANMDEEPSSMICTNSQRDSTNSTENNAEFSIRRKQRTSDPPTENGMLTPAAEVAKTGKESSRRISKLKPESLSQKRNAGKGGEIADKIAFSDGDYENCVKAIRWLECEGHIETNFRVKFLTWFSLRATPIDRRIVGVYVDTLFDDPRSLAGQLMDTFSEVISSKKPLTAPFGVCMKLWH